MKKNPNVKGSNIRSVRSFKSCFQSRFRMAKKNTHTRDHKQDWDAPDVDHRHWNP